MGCAAKANALIFEEFLVLILSELIKMKQQKTQLLSKHIFLVYESLNTGGIETLIVRLANYLAATEVRVTVCCKEGGDLELALHGEVEFIKYLNTKDLLKKITLTRLISCNTKEMLIISFDAQSAARGLMIETSKEKSIFSSHISGIFHPHAYFMNNERSHRIMLNNLIAWAIGNKNLFFMNDECKKSHSIKWNRDLLSCPILALPINVEKNIWQPSKKRVVRVVSVGRLVDFKTYNLGAAIIVKSCLSLGLNVTWDIYGDGPQFSLIDAEINASGVSSHVQLKGILDYQKMSSTIAEYDLFVGMGTAALEAAMVGVPTICATVDEALHCYGYLHELPFGNVGELQIIRPCVEITELIKTYAISDRDYRLNISKRCRDTAKKIRNATIC